LYTNFAFCFSFCGLLLPGLCSWTALVWRNPATQTPWAGSMGQFEGKCMGTPFPLLKCLITHYGRNCEPFLAENAPDCRILYIQSQKLFSGVNTPEPPQREGDPSLTHPLPVTRCLDPDTLSAWLFSVPVVPVSRNGHCPAPFWLIADPPPCEPHPL